MPKLQLVAIKNKWICSRSQHYDYTPIIINREQVRCYGCSIVCDVKCNVCCSVVCEVNIQYFPFDEQTCTITYYAADESTTTVGLDHYLGVDMSKYTENPSLVVVAATRKRYVKNNNWHVDVEFRFLRRFNFATFTLMALAFLIVCVCSSCLLTRARSARSNHNFSLIWNLLYCRQRLAAAEFYHISYFILLISILLCFSVISVFYTVIQAKMFTLFKKKKCPISCFRRRRCGINKVSPIDQTFDQDAAVSDDTYTWEDFLGNLDVFLFVLFMFSALFITSVFFAVLTQHMTSIDIDFDVDPPTTTSTTFMKSTTAWIYHQKEN